VDGVEGERGLSRAREPREHHQLVARDLEVDVLEIVLARATDRDHTRAFERRGAARAVLVEQVGHRVRWRDRIGEIEEAPRGGARTIANVVRTADFRQPAERQVRHSAPARLWTTRPRGSLVDMTLPIAVGQDLGEWLRSSRDRK